MKLEIAPENIINPPPRAKVYCDDCKWRGYWRSLGYSWKWCEAPAGNKFLGYFEVPAVYKSEKNSEGNCKDYKRLWWKFWVKP